MLAVAHYLCVHDAARLLAENCRNSSAKGEYRREVAAPAGQLARATWEAAGAPVPWPEALAVARSFNTAWQHSLARVIARASGLS